jgi:oligopeptide/dipeptide ABC transporter ATP-binding protein
MRQASSNGQLLTLKKVSIGTGRPGPSEHLVRDIDLHVARGEAIGIVGESGSGKSLTALSIAGMLPPALKVLAGEIVFDGKVISGLPEALLHQLRGTEISYVFQDPLTALNPTLTVGRQIIDVLRRHVGGSRTQLHKRAAESLRAVGIQDAEDRLRSYPHQLSGGMRQRVLIAMAMLCNPKLLVADEPTTALDVTVQAKIIDLFREILKTGISLIFISHNIDVVLEFCDRVIVMYGGRVMEVGTAEEIAWRPHHPYTRALLECVPRLGVRVKQLRVIEGQPPTQLGDVPACPFADRCPRVQSRCRSDVPRLTRTSGSHAFACWHPELPLRRAS